MDAIGLFFWSWIQEYHVSQKGERPEKLFEFSEEALGSTGEEEIILCLDFSLLDLSYILDQNYVHFVYIDCKSLFKMFPYETCFTYLRNK